MAWARFVFSRNSLSGFWSLETLFPATDSTFSSPGVPQLVDVLQHATPGYVQLVGQGGYVRLERSGFGNGHQQFLHLDSRAGIVGCRIRKVRVHRGVDDLPHLGQVFGKKGQRPDGGGYL